MKQWLITIACGLAMSGSACNQQASVLDTPAGPTSAPPPPPVVASLLISSAAVNAGGSLQGSVLLSGAAPASGINVSLSASDASVTVEPVVNIAAGQSSAEFTITTRAVPTDRQVVITASAGNRSASGGFNVWAEAPVYFTWFSEPGDSVGTGSVGHLTQATARFEAYCDRNTLNVRLIGPDIEIWQTYFSGPAGVPLRPGVYEGATRWGFNTATPGLMVNGRSRGCNTVGGRFVIHDIDLQNNRVNRFHASFTQRCGNSPGLLNGELRVLNMPPGSSVVNCQR